MKIFLILCAIILIIVLPFVLTLILSKIIWNILIEEDIDAIDKKCMDEESRHLTYKDIYTHAIYPYDLYDKMF